MRGYTFRRELESSRKVNSSTMTPAEWEVAYAEIKKAGKKARDEAKEVVRQVGFGPYKSAISRDDHQDEYLIPGILYDNVVSFGTVQQPSEKPNEGWKHELVFNVYAQGKSRMFGDRINLRTQGLIKRLGLKQY